MRCTQTETHAFQATILPLRKECGLLFIFDIFFMAVLRKFLVGFVAGICFAGSLACAQTPAATEARQADDLPATEAEVSPPVDIWDRIRRGYAMPTLKSSRVKTSL